jgi:hypothetical protein
MLALLATGVIASGGLPAAAARTSPAVTVTDHYLRSGFLTVNGDGEVARFSTTNALTQDLEIRLSLVDPKGNTVASTKGIVGPDKSLTLTYNPTKTTRVHAVFLTTGHAGLLCDGFAPDLELLRSAGGVLRTVEVLDSFWHQDVPAA